MYLDEYGRNWSGPYPFTRDAINNVARQESGRRPGVYKILYMKQPVYIGVSSDSVFKRLLKHAMGAGNKMAGKRADAEFYEFVYWFCDGDIAREIESHVLVENRPGFNGKIEWLKYIASIHVH